LKGVRGLARKHPLIAFFVLAYLLTWWIYPLLRFSPLLGIFGLFGPALAAIIMAAVTGGKSGVKALLSRVVRWRVGLPWYIIALGLPTVLSIATAGLGYLLGASTSIQVGALTVLELVLFVLVVGEELGWRGYALPLLLEKRSAVTASLILGVLWGLWHLPTFLVPGTPQYGLPLTAFVLLTIEYSILMTWVFLHTLGSVLIATLFHGAINLSQGIFLGGMDGGNRYWLLSIVYGVAAVIAAFALVLHSRRKTADEGRPLVQAEDS
jgi:membrane protease YdiL (CAAX protease family)